MFALQGCHLTAVVKAQRDTVKFVTVHDFVVRQYPKSLVLTCQDAVVDQIALDVRHLQIIDLVLGNVEELVLNAVFTRHIAIENEISATPELGSLHDQILDHLCVVGIEPEELLAFLVDA